MYYKTTEAVVDAVVAECAKLPQSVSVLLAQLIAFTSRLKSAKVEETVEATFTPDDGLHAYHIAIYILPSGTMEYVGYHCGSDPTCRLSVFNKR